MKKQIVQVNLEFGKKLKELIKQSGHTYESFGEEIGVCENTVYNWCKGENIDLTNYVKILKFYIEEERCTSLPLLQTNDKITNLLITKFLTSIEDVKEKYDKKAKVIREKLKAEKKKVRMLKVENSKLKLMKLNVELTTTFNDWERRLEEETKKLNEKMLHYKEYVLKDILSTIELCKVFNFDIRDILSKFMLEYAVEIGNKVRDSEYWHIMTMKNRKNIFNQFLSLFANKLGKDFAYEFSKKFSTIKPSTITDYDDTVETFNFDKEVKISIYKILNSAIEYSHIIEDNV